MNKKIEPISPNENIGLLLWQTNMLWQRQMNKVLSEVELTHTQFVILTSLGWLLKSSNIVTQKDIGDISKTDRMMVSKILRKLQKNGLIDRKEHESDSRAKCVYLTPEGQNILQKALEVEIQSNYKFFGKLSNQNNFSNELKQIIK